MNKITRIISGAVALLLLSGFLVRGYFVENEDHQNAAKIPPSDPAFLRQLAANMHIVDTAVSLLRSGQVVIRRGLGADSYMLAEMNSRDKTYSHCGIVMVEHGYPFVYHSIGGEDNPDERLRRDSANFFFSPFNNTHIAIVQYDFTPAQVADLQAVVVQYYKDRPMFDMKFDLNTDDKLYCSEFIYKAVGKAVHDTSWIRSTTQLGRTYIGIDDLYLAAHATMIWGMKFK